MNKTFLERDMKHLPLIQSKYLRKLLMTLEESIGHSNPLGKYITIKCSLDIFLDNCFPTPFDPYYSSLI
jgi:hypothetical protein